MRCGFAICWTIPNNHQLPNSISSIMKILFKNFFYSFKAFLYLIIHQINNILQGKQGEEKIKKRKEEKVEVLSVIWKVGVCFCYMEKKCSMKEESSKWLMKSLDICCWLTNTRVSSHHIIVFFSLHFSLFLICINLHNLNTRVWLLFKTIYIANKKKYYSCIVVNVFILFSFQIKLITYYYHV